MVKIKFFGEGPTDVGREKGEPDDNWETCNQEPGVLQILTLRAINAYFEPHGNCAHKLNYFPRVSRARGLEAKLAQSIQKAREIKADAVVFVMDHDEDKTRLKELKKARELYFQNVTNFPVAIGVPKKKIEAWLLADSKALQNVFGGNAGRDLGDIEDIEDPKAKFKDLYNDRKANSELNEAQLKIKLAQEADIFQIAKNCRKSFEPFLDEIKKNIVPLFQKEKAN